MTQTLVLLGVVVFCFGALPYLRDTLAGRTKPNRVSYFLWFLAPFIGVAASVVQGVTWTAVPVFMAGFAPFLIFIASFMTPAHQTSWKLGPFDWVCGGLSVVALVLWQITKEPNVAILFAILSDGAASLPTLKKCWTHPDTETVMFYSCALFAQVMGVLATTAFSFAEVAFPLYLIIVDFLLVAFVLSGRLRLRLSARS